MNWLANDIDGSDESLKKEFYKERAAGGAHVVCKVYESFKTLMDLPFKFACRCLVVKLEKNFQRKYER